MEFTITLSSDNLDEIAKKVASINANSEKESNKKISYFTVSEASEILKKEPQTVRNHIRKKILTATKTGKCWLISEENLNKYINNEK